MCDLAFGDCESNTQRNLSKLTSDITLAFFYTECMKCWWRHFDVSGSGSCPVSKSGDTCRCPHCGSW